jgi:glycine betaine/proline transport system ATP-binding protein
LNKTIVFITHDFDEALRLADRIAIMKDGSVEQCDTPDQIVLYPATEYVRKFTEDIDKARVVHAGVLAKADQTGTGDPVDARQTVHKLARLLVNDTRDMIPVTRSGVSIGAMARADALDILLGSE